MYAVYRGSTPASPNCQRADLRPEMQRCAPYAYPPFRRYREFALKAFLHSVLISRGRLNAHTDLNAEHIGVSRLSLADVST